MLPINIYGVVEYQMPLDSEDVFIQFLLGDTGLYLQVCPIIVPFFIKVDCPFLFSENQIYCTNKQHCHLLLSQKTP